MGGPLPQSSYASRFMITPFRSTPSVMRVRTSGLRARLFLVFALLSTAILPADAAQLRLRKDVLVQQSDRALISVTGRFEHVEPIPEKGDCELRTAVHANELKVPLVAEFINACSTRLEPMEIKSLSQDGDVHINGVFRIWFEHAGGKDDVLSEEQDPILYETANPKHAVEIHPVIRVGTRNFVESVRAMEWVDFTTYSTAALHRVLKKKATIEEYEADDGTPYVLIESSGSLPTYFHLKAVLRSKPVKTEDGHSAIVDVLDKHRVIAAGFRVFTVEGTKANDALKGLRVKSDFSFWGITRLDGKKALKILDEDTGYHVPVPVEFILLDIHR